MARATLAMVLAALASTPVTGWAQAVGSEARTAPGNAVNAVNTSDAKVWMVRGQAQLRSMAIVDQDPGNDAAMLYNLRLTGRILPGLEGFGLLGMAQRFVVETGEHPLGLQDLQLGARYQHQGELLGRSLRFMHQVSVFTPTSRASRAQDLLLAPDQWSEVNMEVVRGVFVGAGESFQYRFHRYAERAGLEGGENTQLVLGGRLYAEYMPLASERWGSLTIGADVSMAGAKRYASREQYETAASDQVFWQRRYGWSGYALYVPSQHFWFMASLEHGQPVMVNGLVNTHFAHRDLTQMVFTATAQY